MPEPRHTLATIYRDDEALQALSVFSHSAVRELCAALHLTAAEWTWAIRELKESGKVTQTGERRGARYELAAGR